MSVVIVPDGCDNTDIRRAAWSLSDYRVSSIVAGAIYFAQRETFNAETEELTSERG